MRKLPAHLAVILLAATIGLVTPVSADYGRYLDAGGDAKGRLDIADVIYSHRKWGGERRFSHLVSMWRSWKPRMLDRPHRVIHLFFDTRQGVGYEDYSFVTERRVEIFFRRGRLRAALYNHLGDPPRRIANVRVRRSGSRGVFVVIPRRLLKRGRLRYYEWAFMSVFSRKGHRLCPLRDPCVDRTGRRRSDYFRHDL
jgi:hypothetical protein